MNSIYYETDCHIVDGLPYRTWSVFGKGVLLRVSSAVSVSRFIFSRWRQAGRLSGKTWSCGTHEVGGVGNVVKIV